MKTLLSVGIFSLTLYALGVQSLPDPEPNPDSCAFNEEHRECSCEKTCCNGRDKESCASQCLSGCFCREGLVRDEYGNCIELEECGKIEPPSNCTEDQQYYRNKPDCKNTCKNYDNPAILCATGKPGCFCKENLVLRKDGKCVPPEECPQEPICGENEEQTDCAKPALCNTCEIRGNCKLKRCAPGCDCKPGFYRDANGRCIDQFECPRNKMCGLNEQYTTCGSACPDTCDNYGKNRICTLQCVEGCFCKPGYVRNRPGECVLPEFCQKTPNTCNEDERYLTCGSVCPTRCRSLAARPCSKRICRRGCYCKDGLVRDTNLKCVRPEKCSKPECGENEEYNSCGSNCPPTCDKPKPGICKKSCKAGCFCKPGFVRQSKGGPCIPQTQCPAGKCRADEVYLTCGSSCPDTCDNYGTPRICTAQCVPGCFCKAGLVRAADGRCIIPEKCGKENCNEDEEFQDCGTSCPDTCDNYGIDRNCTLQCVRGCFCKRGLVRRNDLKCVIPEECNKRKCNGDEVFKTCGTPCPKTCENYQLGIACKAKCVKGCFCAGNTVRNVDNKKCVAPERCLKKKCRKDEQFYECTPSCKNTCKNYFNPGVRCACGRPGCYCKEGLVKTDDGKCVKPETCPNEKCGKNEEYQVCGTYCRPTCDNRNPICIKACVSGCFCKKNFILSKTGGECIPLSQCPKTEVCGENEAYKKCGTACPPTCGNRNPICNKKCKKGCFCKRNFILSKKFGSCIPVKECRKREQCGENEEYSACGDRCQNTCTDPDPTCSLIPCFGGCVCKKNFLRNNGVCIPKEDCPRKGSCGKNEEFSACYGHCSAKCDNLNPICTKQCSPGCVCKKGFAKDDKGVCIPVKQCPPIRVCPQIRCREGCYLDETNKPCPKCVCKPKECPEVECAGTCRLDGNHKPCPRCVCNIPTECPLINCLQGCRVDYTHKPCPTCVCDNNGATGSCGRNEVFSACNGHCSAKCDNLNPVCISTCIPGCICKKGFAKDKNGICIPVKQCLSRSCGKNEVFSACSGHCSAKCDNLNPACTKQCMPGCICKKGFAKDDKGVCISVKYCPPKGCPEIKCAGNCRLDTNHKPCPRCVCNIPTECPFIICQLGCHLDYTHKPCPICVCDNNGPTGYCGKNEEFSGCNGHCSSSCDNLNPVCIAQCIPGCICKKGFAKDKNGVCIPVKQCRPRSCGKNEEFSGCNGHCSASCDNLNPVCIAQCIPGCICKKGFAKDENRVCIPVKQCPSRSCGKNEEFSGCNGHCSASCDNLNPVCIAQCIPGCICKKGFAKDENGVCIPVKQCPPRSCGKNEKFSECNGHCSARCDNLNPICSAQCIPGCICKMGFAKDENGVCIPAKQCPQERIQCDPPKCDDPGCELDFSTKPCPTCRCQIDEGWGNQEVNGEQTDRRRKSGTVRIESESGSDYYSYSVNNKYSNGSQQVNGGRSSGGRESDNEEIITESYDSDDQTRLSDNTEYENAENQQEDEVQTIHRRRSGTGEFIPESESGYYSYPESYEYNYEGRQQTNSGRFSGRREHGSGEMITESYGSNDQAGLSDYTEYDNGGSEYGESPFSFESSASGRKEDSDRTEREAYENAEQTDYEVFEEVLENTNVNEDSHSISNMENYEERTIEYEVRDWFL